MQIRYVTGDMFASDHAILIHGCNAQGKMGSGVAKIVRERYPLAYQVYRDRYETTGLALGEVVWAMCEDRIIGNAITQRFYGYNGGRYVDYEAVGDAFREVNEFCRRTQTGEIDISRYGRITSVGLPLIGAGLGGGHWPTIAAIIEAEATFFEPVVYTLDGRIPS